MELDSQYEEAQRQYEYHRDWANRRRSQAVENERLASGHDAVAQELANLYPALASRSQDATRVVLSPEPPEPEPPEAGAPLLQAHAPVVVGAPPHETGPRGGPALEALLSSQPGVYYTSARIGEMLVERGWAGPGPEGRAAVRANINRAVRSGLMVKRPLDGHALEYAWRPVGADGDQLLDLDQEVTAASSLDEGRATDVDEPFPSSSGPTLEGSAHE